MPGMDIQALAAARAAELPGAELTHPFGDEWDVYKVRGKVFMLLTELAGEQVVTLKSAPDDSVRYRRTFASITPGYHMNKRHWITVRAAEELDATLIGELVTDSYLLVVENLPRTQRPVDPARFGPTRPGHRQLRGEDQGISL